MSEFSPLLEVSSLSKRFGPVVALRAADLSVRPGEVHALMGANGAGKSTLVKVLTGVLRADGGTIALRGTIRVIGSPAEARRAGLMPVYQDPALIPDLTVLQNLRLTGTSVEAVRHWLSELGMGGIDSCDDSTDGVSLGAAPLVKTEVLGACCWLHSRDASAAASILCCAHQASSFPPSCSERWCRLQSGTTHSSLTLLLSALGWAKRR